MDSADDPTDPTTGPTDPAENECSASIDIVNDWGSGWQGNVTVTAADGDLNGWTLDWTWPSGQTIQSHWNAELSVSGSSVTASDVGWNGGIAAGQSVEVFGFVATGDSVSPQVTCSA
ncbi:cellulose binding domain-containing protein [Glycomyces sp. L485]|uniref:cellulose binding domain-containing protein n=1 Tax=Glycomyces sp. L485 TaxID=2909235 RepID=UPI00321AF9E9